MKDWKNAIVIILTAIGIAVPVWLWNADINSKSLTVRIVTRIPLQPKEQSILPGLQITSDGKMLDNPFLVVIQIKNEGSKPILASDFESAVAITTDSKATFVRAEINNPIPLDLQPSIALDGNSLKLAPMLLNVNDTFSIAAITSGAAPVLKSKARIAGISNIEMDDATIVGVSNIDRVVMLLKSLAHLVVAAVIINVLVERRIRPVSVLTTKEGLPISGKAAALILLLSTSPALSSIEMLLSSYDMQGAFYTWLSYFSLMILAFVFAHYINVERE
jgi:hypothetical protein